MRVFLFILIFLFGSQTLFAEATSSLRFVYVEVGMKGDYKTLAQLETELEQQLHALDKTFKPEKFSFTPFFDKGDDYFLKVLFIGAGGPHYIIKLNRELKPILITKVDAADSTNAGMVLFKASKEPK